ncbi:MAG: hypothetical protein ACRD3Y_08870 [Bryobacteraceae bacterium]
MELHLGPELAAKVEQWSAQAGRPAVDLVEEALAGYLSELGELRRVLDSRYDDLATKRVEPVDGGEAYRLLQERARTRRKSIA